MSDDDKRQRRYAITLTTPAAMTEEESTRRLRAFLKMAWRAFGLRCTSAVEVGHAANDHGTTGRPVPSVRGPA
jgi:hypothetical protein